MRFKNLDLIAAISIAALNVIWTQLPHRPLAPGILLALPLIFILPGYTLTQTFLWKRSQATASAKTLILRPNLKLGQPLNLADFIILSLGLSMAIDIIVGFTLNILPIGLQALPWTLSLASITAICALIAAVLRRRDSVKRTKISWPPITISVGILFGLALLIATVAIWSSMIIPIVPRPSFTQFWLLPVQHNCAVSIGVQSFETTPMTYSIVMTANGSQVNSWPSIALAPQAAWHQSVAMRPGTSATTYVEVRLYKTNTPGSVYRNAHLTLHSLKGNTAGGFLPSCSTDS